MAYVKAFEIGVFAQVQGGERSARVFERQCGDSVGVLRSLLLLRRRVFRGA